jgi:hypothetical protein
MPNPTVTPQKPVTTPGSTPEASLAARVSGLEQREKLWWKPEALHVYKPQRSGGGTALKIQVKLLPGFTDRGFVDPESLRGVWVDLAEQTGVKDGYAQFDWAHPVTAKLGLPDLSGILVAIREFRAGRPLPATLLPKRPTEIPCVEFFHRFGEASTVVTYAFGPDHAFLRISKGKDRRRTIRVTLAEELVLARYLELGLDALLRTGGR